jgi:hypothetical protein
MIIICCFSKLDARGSGSRLPARGGGAHPGGVLHARAAAAACLPAWAKQANQPARQGRQQCCSAAGAAAVPAPATRDESSDSIVQNLMQIQRGNKDISSSQILEKKKEKRENTPNGSIFKCLTFGVLFLQSRCLEWQNCEAQRLEPQIYNFLVLETVRIPFFPGEGAGGAAFHLGGGQPEIVDVQAAGDSPG